MKHVAVRIRPLFLGAIFGAIMLRFWDHYVAMYKWGTSGVIQVLCNDPRVINRNFSWISCA